MIDSMNQRLDLQNGEQRLKRTFFVHFGPFETYEINEASRNNHSSYKRYVLGENCQFIQVEEHLINNIKLESAKHSIDLKEFFPIIKNRLPIESTSDPKKKKLHSQAADNVLLAPILPILNVQNIKTQTYNIAGNSGIQSASTLSATTFQNINATETNDIRENSMQLNESLQNVDNATNLIDKSSILDEMKPRLHFGLIMMNAIKVLVPEIIKNIVRKTADRDDENAQLNLL